MQSEAARDKLRALQIQFEVATARRETELERERQEVLTRANADLDALNISLTEANLQKTMLLDQLERQTYEDALTGLANRRRLDQRLNDEFSLALRHGRPLAVAMADLDHFKAMNDRFSHAVGDAALRATAKILAAQARHTDLVARFGGEEFVLVLVETDAQAAQRVCEKSRPGDRSIQLGLDPPLAFAHDIDRRDRRHDPADPRAHARCGRPQPVYGQGRGPQPRGGPVTPPGPELAHEPHHHAEDLEGSFGTDGRHRPCSRRSRMNFPASISSRFSVNWLSTMATTISPLCADGPLLDHDQVAVEDACIHHRIAFDPDPHRRRRALDQVVVDRERFGIRVVDRLRQARPNRRIRQRAREEASRGRKPAVGRGVEIARELQSRDERRNR